LCFFNTDDPFAGPDPIVDDHIYGDIHTGKWMIDTWDVLCKGRPKRILLPIIFFIDKTHTDLKGNLCQEAVWYTLGIFDYITRRNPRAWRPMGYIPNQSTHRTSKNGTGKLSDYHVVLKHILHQFTELQKKDGFYWEFSYKGQKYEAVFDCRLLFCVGDTEGHDKLCGRYNYRGAGVSCLCRYCDTPFEETGNPHYKYQLLKQTDITSFTVNGELDK
jgi:hypothetical protein